MNKKNIHTLAEMAELNLIHTADLSALKNVTDTFRTAITKEAYDLIDKTDTNDPIAKQFIPSTQELILLPEESIDPIGDDTHKAVKGIVHRYPDRCLLMPVHVCPVYCRFCFRREKVGSNEETLTPTELENALAYIKQHEEIWEVILTGGDPLILKPNMLKKIIQEITAITHVNVIRIHTRVPIVDTARINAAMLDALQCDKALYISLHTNHPKELTTQTIDACKKIIDAGIPMLSQTVLLKGINDNIETLSTLMRTLVKHRIKPYYLHHCDLAKGTGHFRTSISDGQALMQQLRGRLSGLCQPTYVIDIPGGFGKVPIGHHYIEHASAEHFTLEDYRGNLHQYKK